MAESPRCSRLKVEGVANLFYFCIITLATKYGNSGSTFTENTGIAQIYWSCLIAGVITRTKKNDQTQ
jgi:hypothetical protein